MEEKMSLPNHIWGKLNLSWSGFFIALGILNLYVAWNYSTDAWVNFKLFGATGIMVAFIILQAAMLAKYIDTDKKEHH